MILQGDAIDKLRELPSESVQCCVTSPPYWGLRDYGQDGQLGLEKTPEEYVAKMVEVFREVRRVLRKDGVLWLNLGDTYAGSWGAMSYAKGDIAARRFGGDGEKIARPVNSRLTGDLKTKDLVGIPWMVAFALRSDGWWLRSDIIWAKPNPMPESVTDRPTKSHEYLFLLTKSANYFYDAEAIKEKSIPAGEVVFNNNGKNSDMGEYGATREGFLRPDGVTVAVNRNKRSVWTVTTAPYADAHFATYPPDLIKPCIMAGSRFGDTILDPFAGSGTTGAVAIELGRKAQLIELNPKYVELIKRRCSTTPGLNLA